METVLRVAFVYGLILVGLRILCKREFGQLSPLELITLLLVPDLVAQSVVRADTSMTNAVIAITTLFSLVLVTSIVSHRFKKVETWIGGVPTILVARGRFLEENLNRERIAPGEVYAEIHRAGVEHLADVKWAILETDGRISVVPESRSE